MAPAAPVTVRELAQRLPACFAPVDAEMVATGEQLGHLVESFAAIGRAFDALPQTLEGEAVRVASATLDQAAASLAGLADALAIERRALAALQGHHGGMLAPLRALQETVRIIGMLAINAHIVAAGIVASGEDLGGFTRDIRSLVGNAGAAVTGYAEAQARVAALLQAVVAAQAAFESQQGATLRRVGGQIEASLHGLAERRHRAQSAAGGIRDRAQRIAGEIGVLVEALQVGDATRQRLEHVAESLQQVAGSGQDAWTEGLSVAERAAVRAAACHIQVAQIEQAGADFEAERGRLVVALERLGGEAHALVGLGAATYGLDNRRGSFLAELERELGRADALLRACHATREEVDRAVAEIDGVLRELQRELGSVRDLEIDMRLVGLNATFRCARLGDDGRTLGVIAEELRAYANAFVDGADGLMAALRATLDAASAIKAAGRDTQAERLDALVADMGAALAALQQGGGRMDEALTLLDQHGQAAGQSLGAMAHGMPHAAGLASLLQQTAGALAGLTPAAEADADLVALGPPIEALCGRRYTMAAEIEVHRRFAPLCAAVPAPAADGADVLEDVLF